MNDLPKPMTPADCDLKDFKFMPLDVARLRDSDMASEQTPEENWAAVLLWSAAWHQVPAASIPDSDNWIAKAAGYMMRGRIDPRWKEVKPGAMRGFILCSDGRWYHPVVAEKANESWLGKLKQRLKTECARIKKHNDRHEMRIPFPDFDAWFAAGCPVGQPLPVPRDNQHVSLATPDIVPGDTPPLSPTETTVVPTKTPSKGQGEGQGEGQLTSKALADDDISDSSREADEKRLVGGIAPLPMRENPPLSLDPAVQLSVALRRLGVNVMSTNPHLLQWVADQVPLEQLTEAVTIARETKGTAPIPPGYLVPIVEKLRNPPLTASSTAPQKPREDWTWTQSDAGVERKAREMGIRIKPTESYADLKDRIKTEIAKRKGTGS